MDEDKGNEKEDNGSGEEEAVRVDVTEKGETNPRRKVTQELAKA